MVDTGSDKTLYRKFENDENVVNVRWRREFGIIKFWFSVVSGVEVICRIVDDASIRHTPGAVVAFQCEPEISAHARRSLASATIGPHSALHGFQWFHHFPVPPSFASDRSVPFAFLRWPLPVLPSASERYQSLTCTFIFVQTAVSIQRRNARTSSSTGVSPAV